MNVFVFRFNFFNTFEMLTKSETELFEVNDFIGFKTYATQLLLKTSKILTENTLINNP